LFSGEHGIGHELIAVEVDFMEVDGGDLVVIVGGVIADALVKVVAGRIDSGLIFVVAKGGAAALLVDGM